MRVPKTIGFNTKIVEIWMIWGYPQFKKPPYDIIIDLYKWEISSKPWSWLPEGRANVRKKNVPRKTVNILNEFEQGINHTFLWDSPKPGFGLCVIFVSPPSGGVFSHAHEAQQRGSSWFTDGFTRAYFQSSWIAMAAMVKFPWDRWALRITGMTMPLLGLVDMTLGGSSFSSWDHS